MEEKLPSRRKELFIYKPVQLLILKTMVGSGVLCLISTLTATVCFYFYILKQYEVTQDRDLHILMTGLYDYSWVYLVFLSMGILFSSAIIIYGWLKLSHRIAGPLYHIRKNLQELMSGQPFRKIVLRKEDELKDLADLVNDLADKK